jgi:hypothetical protein
MLSGILSLYGEGQRMSGNNGSRVIFQEIERHIDHKTGCITGETTSKIIRHPAEPPYIKLYIDDLCALAQVPESLKSTLLLLLRKLDYDGYITLSPRFRKDACARLGIEEKTLRNRLVMLVQKEMLIRNGTNEYLANPFYFARGDWKSIVEQRQAFQMRITYSESGRKIRTKKTEEQQELAFS